MKILPYDINPFLYKIHYYDMWERRFSTNTCTIDFLNRNALFKINLRLDKINKMNKLIGLV